MIFVINDPEVLKNSSNDNSYAVFGELKLEDPNSKVAKEEVKNFAKEPVKPTEKAQESKEEDKKVEDDS